MIASIYKITNIDNGKQYIGYTKGNINFRWKKHLSNAVRGSKNILHRAIRKHGENSFIVEIIYQSWEPKYCLNVMEEYFIKAYNTHYIDGIGYNMTHGGDGSDGMLGRHHSFATLLKLRKPRINKGKLRRPYSAAYCEKMKGKNLGEKNGMFGKKPANYGIPMSEEQKQKLKQVWKNRSDLRQNYSKRMKQNNPMHNPDVVRRTIETIKQTGACAGGNNGRAKPCSINGITYATIGDAVKASGNSRYAIKKRCTFI
jgi:group I intron endonuclease